MIVSQFSHDFGCAVFVSATRRLRSGGTLVTWNRDRSKAKNLTLDEIQLLRKAYIGADKEDWTIEES